MNVYQRHISREYNGVRGAQCAYHTSCSGYARETLQDEGLTGLPKVLARLRRCTSENTGQRFGTFLRYVANCPERRLEEFFEFESPELRQTFLHFRKQLLQGAAQLAGHQDEAGLATIGGALDQLTQKVHFTISDPPGRQAHPVFKIHPKRVARPTVMADRGKLGNALRGAASLVTGAACGAAAGLAGLVLGPVLGAWEGLASGLGLRSTVEEWANEKYGEGSLAGTTPLRERAQKTYEGTQKWLGLESVANVVGGAVGLGVGLAGGLAGGLVEGAGFGWGIGRVLGRSLADQALAEVFPSRGSVELAVATVPGETRQEPAPVAQRAQKLWSILATAPDELRGRARPAGAPSWRFAVFSDATPSELESAEVRRVMEFESNLPVGASARVHLRRGGLIPQSLQRVWPWAKLVLSAAGLAATGGLSGASLAPVLLARGVSLGLSASAVKELVRDGLTEKEPDWTGQRTYALAGPAASKAARIQAEAVDSHPSAGPVSQARLAGDLAAAFAEEGPRVAVFTGHGQSYEKIAGYDPKLLAGALHQVADESGRKTDLVVLEGCYTATLEALQSFSSGARYALVSQLPVRKVGLPWNYILKNLDELGQDAKTLATRIVEVAGGGETVPSLSLIDLSQIEGLTRELEALAVLVPAETLAAALPAGDHPEEGWGKRVLRQLTRWLPGSHSGDLSKILRGLEGRLARPEQLAQLARVQESLSRVVVCSRGENLGGLSVETASPLFDRQRYQEATGLKAWGEALGAAQPGWLQGAGRVAHWAEEKRRELGEHLVELRYGPAR